MTIEDVELPTGYVLVGIKVQSLWSGAGWGYGVVCVRSGKDPVIDTVGNLYDGPRTWDIERRGDIGEIRFGLRTKSVARMCDWLARREDDIIEAAIARRLGQED